MAEDIGICESFLAARPAGGARFLKKVEPMLSATTLRKHPYGMPMAGGDAVSPGLLSCKEAPLRVFSSENRRFFPGEGIKEKARILLWDESGVTMVEYGMLIALISVACLVALSAFGMAVSTSLYGVAVTAMGS